MSNNLKLDVCISFDTTGSMYPCLYEVRRNLKQLVEKLFTEGNDVRVAVIAHGDYCDAADTYTLKQMDFTTNERKLVDFINSVGKTYGGDAPECYEYALHVANTLDWRDDSKKIFIMIGDATPHGTDYYLNVEHYDWTKEVGKLTAKNIKVYPVHAMPGARAFSLNFYRSLAQLGKGTYLSLDQFVILPDLILATAYAQADNCEVEDLEQFNTSYCMDNNIKALLGKETTDYKSKDGLVPVPDGAYQVFKVDTDTPIKVFVEEAGIEFHTGEGFYELTKTETVQQYKEIFLQERATGKLFTGPQVRAMLELLPKIEGGRGSGAKERIKPVIFNRYKVFIQSTSYNRKLKAGTSFLYKVPDEEVPTSTDYIHTEEKPVLKDTATKTSTPTVKDSTKTPIPTAKDSTKTPKRYVTSIETRKRRLIKSGDLLIKKSGLVCRVEIIDGEYKVHFRGKVYDIDLTLYKAVLTPKLKSNGEPETSLSKYSEEDFTKGKYVVFGY